MTKNECLLSLALIVAPMLAFGGGSAYKEIRLRPKQIGNNCAYYDMSTGNFTWGPKPVVLGMESTPDLGIDLSSTQRAAESETKRHTGSYHAKKSPKLPLPDHKPEVPYNPTVN